MLELDRGLPARLVILPFISRLSEKLASGPQPQGSKQQQAGPVTSHGQGERKRERSFKWAITL